ncbi:MAG: CHAT domain-containing protein, partial [Chitinophagales bacterium]
QVKALVFNFSEQCKAILLLSNLKNNEAKAFAKIPTVLLEQEKEFQSKLNELESSISKQEVNGNEKEEALISQLQSQHFKQKQQYDALIEKFEVDYPEYHQLKYSITTASIQDLQSYLQETNTTIQQFNNTTITQSNSSAIILSYHIGKDKIYIFAITSNDYQITTIEKPADFSNLIEKLQGDIQLGYVSEFIKSATQLFDILLQPVWDFLQESSKLIIIPHGELYYVPFDVLFNQHQITDIKNFENLPYLIRDFDISYHYSATLLLHSHQRQQQTGEQVDSFFGLAPVHFGGKNGSEVKEGYVVKSSGKQQERKRRILKSSGNEAAALQDLEETEVEVKEVYQLFEEQGKEAIALFYDQANKQNLQEHIGGYKYVLISTHGFLQETSKNTLSGIHLAPSGARSQESGVRQEELASTEYPSRIHKASTASIESDDYILHTSETYHLNLNADLVVLSSCESGVGELKVGEGMMALNRGFLYAGASNIVYSLFKVPEDSTSRLTQALFRYILEGENYAQALRKAKLELINDGAMEPMDWAGFALVGG